MVVVSHQVAALFVDARGPYAGLPLVDAWPIRRDARLYRGPLPVVAHPECKRWGRYWRGQPGGVVHQLGDDGGMFRAALDAVRAWRGVLEHPHASRAWPFFGLLTPPRWGGWVAAGDGVGWTCCVEQGHYGHAAPKPTWLYAVGVPLPSLRWGPSGATGRIELFTTSRQRSLTPAAFRDVLLTMAMGGA